MPSDTARGWGGDAGGDRGGPGGGPGEEPGGSRGVPRGQPRRPPWPGACRRWRCGGCRRSPGSARPGSALPRLGRGNDLRGNPARAGAAGSGTLRPCPCAPAAEGRSGGGPARSVGLRPVPPCPAPGPFGSPNWGRGEAGGSGRQEEMGRGSRGAGDAPRGAVGAWSVVAEEPHCSSPLLSNIWGMSSPSRLG